MNINLTDLTTSNCRCFTVGAWAAFCLTAASAAQSDPTFVDVALDLGFQDRLAHGRALAAADFDNNGWTDFFIGNPSRPELGNDASFVVWNLGPDRSGNFQFRSGPVLLRGEAAFGASAADYDNDGDVDLFIAVGGQETVGLDFLFRNDRGVFTDVSEAAGVRGPRDARGEWAATASLVGHWADYDRDGDLDLFVPSKYHGPRSSRPDGLEHRDSLFRNDGDGTFTDVSVASGVAGSVSTKAGAWGDYDNDGWVDLFLPVEEFLPASPHDFRLLRNNRDGTFVEMPLDEEALGVGTRSWASCNADFNNDGWLDIMVFARGRIGAENDSHALLLNQGNWTFVNAAESSGLAVPGEAAPGVMGCQIGDIDNDGYPDLLMANGGPTGGESDILLINEYTESGGLRFRDASALIDHPAPVDRACVPPVWRQRQATGLIDSNDMSPARPGDPHAVDSAGLGGGIDPCNPPFPYRGHAIALTDFDKDGDHDLAMIKGGTEIILPWLWSGEPNRFFRNDGGNSANWLALDLRGRLSNAQAVGARVEVVAKRTDGSRRRIYDEVRAGRCFSASGPAELLFGLDDARLVEAVQIDWPSGIRTRLTTLSANQRLRIEEPVLASSRFNDGAATGWTAFTGDWRVVDGAYRQPEAASGRHLSASGQPRENFSVVAKLTYLDGAGKMALAGRVSEDGQHYYAAVLTGSIAQLYIAHDDVLTPLGAPLEIEPMSPGKSYIVTLRFENDFININVDGRGSEPVTDRTLTSGRIGLVTSDTAAEFDNVAVY